jgi:hypothetical protein
MSLLLFYRCFSLIYRVSKVGTEAVVALWYKTTRVPIVTHDNVLESLYTLTKSQISSIEVVTNLSSNPRLPQLQSCVVRHHFNGMS